MLCSANSFSRRFLEKKIEIRERRWKSSSIHRLARWFRREKADKTKERTHKPKTSLSWASFSLLRNAGADFLIYDGSFGFGRRRRRPIGTCYCRLRFASDCRNFPPLGPNYSRTSTRTSRRVASTSAAAAVAARWSSSLALDRACPQTCHWRMWSVRGASPTVPTRLSLRRSPSASLWWCFGLWEWPSWGERRTWSSAASGTSRGSAFECSTSSSAR